MWKNKTVMFIKILLKGIYYLTGFSICSSLGYVSLSYLFIYIYKFSLKIAILRVQLFAKDSTKQSKHHTITCVNGF